jgi:hypothetical protein
MIMMDYQNNTWSAPNGESPAIAYLSRVGELDRQIRLKKSKLEILRDALSLRSPVMTDMPKAPSPSLQSMEDRLCNILALEDEIKVMEQEMSMLKMEVMSMIGKIDNAEMQMVLIHYFLKLLTTAQVCRELHYSRGWLLKLKSSAIEEMERVLARKGE